MRGQTLVGSEVIVFSILLLTFMAFVQGCTQGQFVTPSDAKEIQTTRERVVGGGFDLTWRAARHALSRRGLTMSESDEQSGTIVTDWREIPSGTQLFRTPTASYRYAITITDSPPSRTRVQLKLIAVGLTHAQLSDLNTKLEILLNDIEIEVLAARQRTPTPREGSPKDPIPETSSKGLTHRVQEGETLGGIAQTYTGNSDNWKVIAEHNNISDPRTLRVGQIISIPEKLARTGREEYRVQEEAQTGSLGKRHVPDETKLSSEEKPTRSPVTDMPPKTAEQSIIWVRVKKDVKGGKTPIHEGPEVFSKLIGEVFAGEKIRQLGVDGNWVHVKIGDREGYIYKDFVQDE